MLFRVKRLFINNFAKCVGQKRFKHTEFEPLFERMKTFWNKTAIHDYKGSYTYGNVFLSAKELSQDISRELGGKIHERVLFLCSNDVNYVVTLLAIWMSGQTAVPLSPLHPENVITYYAEDTKSKLLLSTPEHANIVSKIAKSVRTNLFVMDDNLTSKYNKNSATVCDQESCLTMPSEIYEYSDGMIIYTSGTTGKSKGVVLPHKTLFFQTSTLIDAWKWSSNDIILHTLPLHHIHGTVNALFCPLCIGATIVMLPRFSAETVWSYLLGKRKGKEISVFMAVPTIYAKLVEEFEQKYANKTDEAKHFLKENVRLMVSGSAPLPIPLHEKWFEITGHKLLERYGMTEIGMCLSNEYKSDRVPGYVGVPLPGVSVRLVEKSEETNTYNILLECTNQDGLIKFSKTIDRHVKGELLVKGENVFKEYFNKPEATKKGFTEDGWFITGDICEYSTDRKRFRMLGRKSVDIIKSGGYKISSLQIETSLLAHPEIKECAVLGLEDPTWGEKIAAIIVPEPGCDIDLDSLRNWASDKMPKYHLPTKLQVVESIPKNVMGKVNKKELKNIFSE